MNFQAPQRLASGLDVYLLPTDKFKTVSFRFVFQRDLGDEATKNAMVPAILRRGCKPYPTTRALVQRLEELYGSRMGGDVRKVGETHLIEFYLDVVNEQYFHANAGLLEQALDTLRALIAEPITVNGSFHPEYFSQEQEILREKIRGLINDKRRFAFNRAVAQMCASEPFGVHKWGKEEDLEQITDRSLYEHYRQVRTSSPVAVFAVGDFDQEKMLNLLSEKFAAEERREMGLRPALVDVPVEAEKEIVEEEEVNQAVLVMGFRTYSAYPRSDYYAHVMANGILGGFAHSKLFTNVREKYSLAYYAHSSLEATKGLLMATAGIDAANYEQAVRIIREQVDAIRNGDITVEEMDATYKGIVNAWNSLEDDVGQMIDAGVVEMVNNRLRSKQEAMEALSQVTREDVMEAAGKWKLDTVYFLRPGGGKEAGTR